jgi:RHS repeat-associated protein
LIVSGAGSIASCLPRETTNTTTTCDLTDAQGTILLSLTASAIQGEQIYDPYGNIRYSSGTIGTDKGYTGQFDDAVTGLDYYNARWYDPVSGQFLSPDTVQGNAQGMDPYAYVGNDPETRTDPTGQMFPCSSGCGGSGGSTPPHSSSPSPDAITNWCLQNTACNQAYADYYDGIEEQWFQDAAYWLLLGVEIVPSLAEALLGDPEGFEAEESQFSELTGMPMQVMIHIMSMLLKRAWLSKGGCADC